MESGLNSATTATAPPPIAPAPAPAPTPAPAPAPAPMNMGGGSSKVTDIVKKLNPVEVLFGVLGAAALYYTIYYFKYNLAMNKGFKNEIENKVDELSMKVADVQSALERDKSNTTPGFF
jgi:hypothetical protein